MAEIIAAISFVSAIAGLVEIGSKAIKRLNDFRCEAREMPDALRHISSQLPLVVDSLSRSKARAQSNEVSVETQNALLPTVEACTELLNRLENLLRDLLPVKDDSAWDRKMKALKSLSKDKYMQSLLVELDRYIITFTLHNTSISNVGNSSASLLHEESLKTIPSKRDPNFVDRPKLFHALEANLNKYGRAALSGVGGVGKTQIAIEYCYRYLDHPSAGQVFWIYSNSVKKMSQACRNIAEELRLPGWKDPKTNPIELFQNHLLQAGSVPKLVVLDNVDDATMLEEDLCFQGRSVKFADLIPRTAPVKVLLTSRDRRVGERLAARGSTVTVHTMVVSESIQLLHSYLPQTQENVPSEEEDLVHNLDYLPLAITQAAAYITEECISLEEYLSMLQESDEQLEELLNESLSDDRRGHQDGNSPIKTWKISFDHIVKIDQRASEMLLLMACYDRNHIQSSLVQRKTESRLHFLKAAATLECFNLISKDPGGNAYKMHRLVQVATQAWSRTQESTSKVRLEAITTLSMCFPSGEYETWRECEALLPHTRVVRSRSHESEEASLQYAKLLTKVSWFYRCQGLFNDSRSVAQEAHNIFRDFKGPDDPDAHSNTITKIDCQMQLLDLGSFRNAIENMREIHASLEARLGPEDPETLRVLGNLAWALYQRDFLQRVIPEEATLLLRKVLYLRERVLGVEHPKTMTTMNNLGLALDSTMELMEESESKSERVDDALKEAREEIGAESLTLLTECLNRCKHRLGLGHPDTIEIQFNLGTCLLARDAHAEAQQLLRSCIASRVALFGPYHVDIISPRSALARCLFERGCLDDAIEIGRETVTLAESLLGQGHRETLVNRHNLAIYLKKAEQYMEALQHYQLLMIAKPKDSETWSGLEKLQYGASWAAARLIIGKWPTRPCQRMKMSRMKLLTDVIHNGTSGWRRDDLDQIQILRLLFCASEATVGNLDPLPDRWEVRLSKSNEVYFANKRSKSTTWLDPRFAPSKGDWLADLPSFETEHVRPSGVLGSAMLSDDELEFIVSSSEESQTDSDTGADAGEKETEGEEKEDKEEEVGEGQGKRVKEEQEEEEDEPNALP